MSSFSFSPVNAFQSLTTRAASSSGKVSMDRNLACRFSIDPVSSRNAMAVYKGIKKEIKSSEKYEEIINPCLALDAHSKKLSQRCLDRMSKIFGLLPNESQIALEYIRMHDSDVSKVLEMIKPGLTAFELVHLDAQEMGALVVRQLARFLVEREVCLSKLGLTVQHIGHHALYLLADALSKTQSLTFLSLAGMKLDAEGLSLLQQGLSSNSSIRVLRLLGLEVPPNQGEVFKAIFKSAAIQHLILSGKQPELLSSVTQSFSDAPQLKTLTIASQSMTPEEAQLIGSAMSSAPYLETLEIKAFTLSEGATGPFILSLSKSLEGGSALQTISLQNAQMRDEDGVRLANALEAGNSKLEDLILSRNELGDQTADAFAQLLSKNSCLRTLNLGYNQFTIQGVLALLRSLLRNNSLRDLDVTPNYGNNTYSAEDMIAELAQIIEELKANNSAFTLPRVKDNLTEEQLSIAESSGQFPSAVIEFFRFLLRNRHNEKARDATLYQLLFPLVNEEASPVGSSASPTCSSS